MKTAIELIADERQRQIDKEGYTTEHDDKHLLGEISDAAACYASKTIPVPAAGISLTVNRKHGWPWEEEAWKPTPNDRMRELTKAGALIVAEMERLQRLSDNA